jgi:formylglycine-generating enzyme required for sulfatase activity
VTPMSTPKSPTAHRPELPPLVLIPGGIFTMGRDSIVEAEAPNPPHQVELSSFWLGIHPVTNAEYAAFVKSAGAAPPQDFSRPELSAPNRHVTGVGWQDAKRYCEWAGGTLPTEAQWERAARGEDGRRYPWGDDEPDPVKAGFAEDWNRGGPSLVGVHPEGAGPYGCHDLAGSVWEWCLDAFQPDAHLVRPGLGLDPCVCGTTRVRPLRGGCWRSIDCKLQAAYRNWSHEAARHTTIGFRLCIPAAKVIP